MSKYGNLVLGTMTFGEKVDLKQSFKMIDYFAEQGGQILDTAYVYNDGLSEEFLGRYLKQSKNSLIIATKVNPRVTGSLDREAIIMQVEESLKRLQSRQIDLLYIHFPDRNTSLEEILSTCNDLFVIGKVKSIGLSNFSAEMVQDVCDLCETMDWVTPSVYEGMYNVFARKVEKTLFDTLRKNKMKFYAYNPLAGGLLSGRYDNFEEDIKTGRFANRPNYKNRYWKKENFIALNELNEVCKRYNIGIREMAYRWLAHNSYLSQKDGDSIILGASNVEQLKDNICSLSKGDLPLEIVSVIDKVWKRICDSSPEYYRYVNSEVKK
ncbi:General stress protein 69 [Candidatus Izimaplasma bacterium HR1]|jgi:aflatoxin B1 aldehyde reductase|uniref:aldo/keto reductase family protein n=1 Tax=Candidatus Izimoplasma sp. HR1 TaxID=1541959 RepID=UPI0004F60BB6|nr:General stress protein 69 [Candidatus Izimaplasma bacterium HR1]